MYDAELEKAGATEDQDVAMADGGLDAVCREVVCKLYFEDHTQGNNPQKKYILRAHISGKILSGRTVGETKTNFARRRTKKFGKDGNVDHKKVILF